MYVLRNTTNQHRVHQPSLDARCLVELVQPASIEKHNQSGPIIDSSKQKSYVSFAEKAIFPDRFPFLYTLLHYKRITMAYNLRDDKSRKE
jgi:hypothetical protein